MVDDFTELGVMYERRLLTLRAAAEQLEDECRKALDGDPLVDSVTFRCKDKTSFITKAQCTKDDGSLKYSAPLVEIEDQIAGRVIVKFVSALDPATEAIRSWFGPSVEFRRRRTAESEFGYESDHFIIVIPNDTKDAVWQGLPDMPLVFELQVRTIFMHAYAQPEHLLRYKGQVLSAEDNKMLAWIAASAWGADQALDQLHRSRTC